MRLTSEVVYRAFLTPFFPEERREALSRIPLSQPKVCQLPVIVSVRSLVVGSCASTPRTSVAIIETLDRIEGLLWRQCREYLQEHFRPELVVPERPKKTADGKAQDHSNAGKEGHIVRSTKRGRHAKASRPKQNNEQDRDPQEGSVSLDDPLQAPTQFHDVLGGRRWWRCTRVHGQDSSVTLEKTRYLIVSLHDLLPIQLLLCPIPPSLLAACTIALS